MRGISILIGLLLIISVKSFAVTYNAIVAKDGSGNYKTIQAALNAAPSNSTSRWVIFIKSGTYNEMINVAAGKNKITLLGECNVKVTFNRAINDIDPATGKVYSVKNSATAYVYGTEFYANGIAFENTAGPAAGQALAIYVRADKAVFVNCKFLGNQDTFYGHMVRMYLYNCYLEGTVDFIYGEFTGWFEKCQLYAKGSVITAANTEPFVKYGYVFNNCTITGTKQNNTLLGRSWGPYAATTFLNCSLSNIIKPEGWGDFGDAANQKTARYREYKNTGDGANTSKRVSWSKTLSASEASAYTVLNVLKTTYATSPVSDNWNPQTVIDLYPLNFCESTTPATLTKSGSGAASQTVVSGTAITSFTYTWENATSVTVTGLPTSVTSVINTANKTVTISGTSTIAGAYNYTITTTGGNPNATATGTITVTAGPKPTDCAGVENGTASLDNCDRCIGGTTGKVACTSAGEAETDACSFNGTVDNNNLGFKGTGFINVPNGIGSEITFYINAASSGTTTLSFRYASGGTADRAATFNLNGTALATNLSFPATGAFTTYKVVDVSLALNEGVNVLQLLSTTADGLANIDQIGYVSAGLSKGDCEAVVTSVIKGSEGLSLELYPNPSQNSFNIRTSAPLNIEITNAEGKTLKTYSNVSELEFGNDLLPGVYFAKVQNKVYKIVKN